MVTFADGSKDIATYSYNADCGDKAWEHYYSVIYDEYFCHSECEKKRKYNKNNGKEYKWYHYGMVNEEKITRYLTPDELNKAAQSRLNDDDINAIINRIIGANIQTESTQETSSNASEPENIQESSSNTSELENTQDNVYETEYSVSRYVGCPVETLKEVEPNQSMRSLEQKYSEEQVLVLDTTKIPNIGESEDSKKVRILLLTDVISDKTVFFYREIGSDNNGATLYLDGNEYCLSYINEEENILYSIYSRLDDKDAVLPLNEYLTKQGYEDSIKTQAFTIEEIQDLEQRLQNQKTLTLKK